jgi:hypothetical protein
MGEIRGEAMTSIIRPAKRLICFVLHYRALREPCNP